MKRCTTGFRRANWIVLSLCVLAANASASFTGPALHIEATSTWGTASYDVSFEQLAYNPEKDSYSWNLGGPVEMTSQDGHVIGTLSGLSSFYQQDPIIGLGFAVQAGSSATHFTINSALLSFSTINPAEGQASSGVSVTDFDGDGASFTGTIGGNSYGAYYNGFLTNLFSSQIGSFAVGSNLTDVRNGAFGFAGMGSVSDMSATFDFVLSANDMASGTSRYEVRAVPEPASILALAIGALALRRRRK